MFHLCNSHEAIGGNKCVRERDPYYYCITENIGMIKYWYITKFSLKFMDSFRPSAVAKIVLLKSFTGEM